MLLVNLPVSSLGLKVWPNYCAQFPFEEIYQLRRFSLQFMNITILMHTLQHYGRLLVGSGRTVTKTIWFFRVSQPTIL